MSTKNCNLCGSVFARKPGYSNKQWESRMFCSKSCSLKYLGKNPDKSLQDRFYSKFLKGKKDECWEWLGSADKNGYGRVNIAGKPMLAHRFSYLLNNGELPNNLHVMHLCDNPKCVNPGHLRLGTDYDNMRDCINKGRDRKSKGEQHFRSRLKESDVHTIRDAFKNNNRKCDIVRTTGFSYRMVYDVLSGRTWKHV